MASIHWTHQVNGSFTNSADWTGGLVPGAGDDALLDAAGVTAFTVTSSSYVMVNSIQTSAKATLAITGGAFDATKGTGAGVNAGTVSVGSTATFEIGGTFANTGVVLTAKGGRIELVGATVTGGTVTTAAGSEIYVYTGASKLMPATLTNAGAIKVGDYNTLTVGGLITNSGVIGLYNPASPGTNPPPQTRLVLGNNTTLAGGGSVKLDNGLYDWIVGGASPTTLTNLDNTISGAGYVSGSALTVVNQAAGLIGSASGSANGLRFQVAGFSNAGRIEASGAVIIEGAPIGGGNYLTPTVINTGTATAETGGELAILSSLNNQNLIDAVGSGYVNVQGVSLTNSGTISDTSAGTIKLRGALTNSGVIKDNGSGAIGIYLPYGAGYTVTNTGLMTDTGTGALKIVGGSFPANAVANGGTILISAAGGLDLSDVAVTNSGRISITGAAGLSLFDSTLTDTTAGTFSVAANMSLQGAVLVMPALTLSAGHTVTVSGGGAIAASEFKTSSVTNLGTIDIAMNRLLVQGVVNNRGVIDIGSGSAAVVAELALAGPAFTLTGGGSIVLGDGGDNSVGAYLVAGAITNLNNTISGAGAIGASNVKLTNDALGVINATGVNVLTLTSPTLTNAGLLEDTGAGGLAMVGAMVNGGTILATGAGGLAFSNMVNVNTVTNTGKISVNGPAGVALTGVIINDTRLGTVSPVSKLTLLNGGILGGVLTVAAGGMVTSGGIGGYHSLLATSTLTNLGTIAFTGGLEFTGAVVNTGTIFDGGAAGVGAMLIGTPGVTLTGAGAIVLDGYGGGGVYALGAATKLINTNNTISGDGTLGNANLTLINQVAGIIDDNTAHALYLMTGTSTITNAGLIEATGAGKIVIESAVANSGTVLASGAGGVTLANLTLTDTAAGLVSVAKGSRLDLTSVTITGGAITNAGALTAMSGQVRLDTATLNNSGVISVGNPGVDLHLQGVVNNSGTINVGSATAPSRLSVDAGGVTLTGAGKVVLGAYGSSYFGAYSAATSLTNDGETILGAGQIGNAYTTLVNQAGLIEAFGTHALVLNTGANTIVNAGTLEADGTGGLTVMSAVADSGQIDIVAGAATFSAGLTVSGAIGGAGTLNLTGGATNFNAGATLTVAKVTVSGVSTVVDVASGLTYAGLWTQTAGTLAGTGTLDLTAAGDTLQNVDVAAATLDIAASKITLGGTLTLAGQVNVASPDVIISGTTELTGGGVFQLSNLATNTVIGASVTSLLDNAGDTIEGAGNLGGGKLRLTNAAGGRIIGNDSITLIIDTSAVANAGLIENTGTGGTIIDGSVGNTGTLMVAAGTLTVQGAVTGAGTLIIGGGTADIASAFSENVTFTAGGMLELAHAATYAGTISGFSTTGTTSLDLRDIGVATATASYSGTTAGGVLTVSDGTHTAKIKLHGDFLASSFTLSNDGAGGTTVVDPPKPANLAAAMASFAPRTASASPIETQSFDATAPLILAARN